MKTGNENIGYYNAIANEYNDMLDTGPDRIIREKVSETFCSLVKGATVLDFGGGTGLDLKWLTDNYRTVFFCEPSSNMREKAINNYSNLVNNKVIFLDDAAADFTRWSRQRPFMVKVDAILSNFAVLNCIAGIKLLFHNLSLVIKQGGDIMALVLTKDPGKVKNNFNSLIKTFIYNKPATMQLLYKEHRQTVYIYSVDEIIKASSQYFDFFSSEMLPGTGFTLIHLKRK